MVVLNFRAASAAAQHQQPRSSLDPKRNAARCSGIRGMTRHDVGIRFTYALGGAVHRAVAGPMDAASAKNTALVHGACFDGSGWEPVCEIPFKEGYHVSVDQEPLTSLLDDVPPTRRVVALQPGPCILLADSSGGTVATRPEQTRASWGDLSAQRTICNNSRPETGATMGQVTALAKALAKAPSPQVDPFDCVTVHPMHIAESAQQAMSACQTFGPFRFFPARQLLLEGETPVRLGSRALEILAALVERPGELVSKDELTARVWPNTVVEESNLKVNVAALRRALGEGRPGQHMPGAENHFGPRFPIYDLSTKRPVIEIPLV